MAQHSYFSIIGKDTDPVEDKLFTHTSMKDSVKINFEHEQTTIHLMT